MQGEIYIVLIRPDIYKVKHDTSFDILDLIVK